MIETLLDTLYLYRNTFLKALYDGIGLSEAASEYLNAHSVLTKSDIYYQPVYNENILLMIAKQEANPPVYGEDFFGGDPQYNFYRQQGQNISAQGDEYGGETLGFETQYLRDIRATNFDNAPSPTAPIENIHYLEPANNPILRNVEHTFSNGKKEMIPSWYASLLNYYAVSEDDKFHSGMSRAEYDHNRIAGWVTDGKDRVTPNVANQFGLLHGLHEELPEFTEDGSNFRRLNAYPEYGTPLQKIENMFNEVTSGDFTLKDYLHGFEGLSKRQRDEMYDHLLENGYDGSKVHMGKGGISDDHIRFNLGLRLKPLMDFLTRPTSHSSDNHIGRHENIPTEHAEIPNHVWNSLEGEDIRALHTGVYNMLGLGEKNKIKIEELAKNIFELNPNISEADAMREARLADLLSYDIFRYGFKDKSISMRKLGGKPAKDFDDWVNNKASKNLLTRSGFYAATNWDNDRGVTYEIDKQTNKSSNPTEEFRPIKGLIERFTPTKIKNIESRMKTGKDAIYAGTHMRNHAVPWMDRMVDLDFFGDYMGGDDRGFNDIFAEKFQHEGGHHLDLNNALRVIAPIFHHVSTKESPVGLPSEYGQNLLFDVEHPEMFSRRSFINEDPDKDLYYIGPIEEYNTSANLGDTASKPIRSTSKALAWAGQPQLTRFFQHIYDADEYDDYVDKINAGITVDKPRPKKRVLRSLGDIPHVHKPKKEETGEEYSTEKYQRKLAQRRRLQEIAETISPSAHLSQYITPYFGAGRGTGGLLKKPKGYSHSVESTKHSGDGHMIHMRTSNPNKNPDHRRRLAGESSIERDFQAIRHNFRRAGPEAHRREIKNVDQQTRAEFNKNQEASVRHESTGAANEPNNPQKSNVLGIDERIPFNRMASEIFSHHRTRDNVDREEELKEVYDKADKEYEERRNIAANYNQAKKDLENRLSQLGSQDYDERRNLLDRYIEVEKLALESLKEMNEAFKARKEANRLLEKERTELPQMTKEELTDFIEQYKLLQGTPEGDEIENKLREEHDKLSNFNGRRSNTLRRENNKKYDADMNAIGLKVNAFRKILDSQGISIGENPFEMLSNLMVLAHEGERSLHSHQSTGENDPYQTYNESVEDEKTELKGGGSFHNSIRNLIMANGQHIGDIVTEKSPAAFGTGSNFKQIFANDKGHISNDILNLMRAIQNEHENLPMSKRKDIALQTRQMPVRDLLLTMHPELKGDVLSHESSIKHALDMRELLHLDNGFRPTKKTEAIERALGIHFIPAKHGEGPMSSMLDGHIVVNPTINTSDVTHINTPSMQNRMMPISNLSKRGGKGINCFFTDPNSHFKYSGYKPTIRPVRDNRHRFVRWEKVEPYDYDSRTPPMSIYEQGVPELMQHLGQIDTSNLVRPNAYSVLFKRHGEKDAAMLLASLSNPDIMHKADGDYPILQAMHRIFTLDDLEHLRGFSGDWIVSAMPEGPRAFVEKKDDKVTVRGDFVLDDETKENFTKITKKDYLVDVVLANKEYNIIDIVQYEDNDVHDMSLQERMKILRGTMHSTENVLLPAAHNLRLTDDVGLEVIVKDLLKEHKRLLLRDANSTYMKGESRHPKWVLYDEGQNVNLMVLDRKGNTSYTYRLGTGPITHEESLGNRAVKYEGETYMDVGTSFQSEDKYEVGDIVTVNVDSVSVAENIDGADIYTVSSNEIKGEAEGEGVSSVETLSMFTKSEPLMLPHEIDRDGDRIVIKMAAGDVSYRASSIAGDWYMFNPKADNNWLIRLSESQRPFWSSVAGVMLKADLSVLDEESKAEVHESKNDGKPLIPPKKVTNTNFWDSEVDDAIERKKKVKRLLAKSLALASSMLKSGVGAVGDSFTGVMGLGMGYATPTESPTGPTNLHDPKTMPDYDTRKREGEETDVRDVKTRKPIRDEDEADIAGHLTIDKDKAAFVSY